MKFTAKIKTTLLSSFLVLNHLVVFTISAPVMAEETANTGAPSSCPFQGNNSATDTISKVRAALKGLIGNSSTCSETISRNAASLDELLESVLEQNFPINHLNLDGSTPLTCDNYQGILAKEKQLVAESKSNEYFVVGDDFLPRYRPCEKFKKPADEIDETTLDVEYQGLSQGQRFDLCIDKVYQEAFYRKVEECEIRSELEQENRKNEAYRAKITEISRVATNLISSSSECSNTDIIRNITQSVIPLITTMGSFAVAGPVAGAGIALGGSVLSALVDRFFNNTGANEYLQLIEGEEQWTDLNCLYYSVQNEVLACGKPDPESLNLPVAGLTCSESRQDEYLADINKLSELMKKITAATDPLGQADLADQIRAMLSSDITLPDGSKAKLVEYLEKATGSLESDVTKSADVITASRLKNVVSAYKDWDTARSSGSLDVSKMTEANKKLVESVKGTEGAKPLDLVDLMRRFWTKEQASKASTMVGRLKAMETSSPMLSKNTPFATNDIQTYESTRLAHDAFVSLYRVKFENRLEKQYETYLKNRKPKTDTLHHTNLDYLIPMFQSCTLNAGMHFFKERDGVHHSVGRVGSEPSEEYSRVCSMFNCPGETLVPKFTPDKSGNSVGTQFKSYQCALNAQYNQLLARFVQNYRKTGEVCPKPSPSLGSSEGSLNGRDPAVRNVKEGYTPDGEKEGGGGLFGWLGDLFGGIVDFFKNLF